MLKRWMLIAVLVGAALDVGVFITQEVQYGQVSTNTDRGNCWFPILDKAVVGHTPQSVLKAEARKCTNI